MENRTINIAVVAEVAGALQDLKQQMVFVGGAVVSLYTDDPAADEIRPTQDIDMTLNIMSLGHWQKVQQRLGKLGFHPDPFGHAICSYKYQDIPVDIMASEDGPLGSANKWYKIGFENLWKVKVMDQVINLLSAPCYVATKFEAFNNRGRDYRTSHLSTFNFFLLRHHLSQIGVSFAIGYLISKLTFAYPSGIFEMIKKKLFFSWDV